MKSLLHSLFLLVVVTGAAQVSVAQSSEISREEYFGALQSGMAVNEKIFPRRSTKTSRVFASGRVTEESSEISEFLAEGKMRRLITSTYEGEKSVSEIVQANGNYYCREGVGEWFVSKDYCAPQGFMELPDSNEVKFSVSTVRMNGNPVRLFEQIRVYDVEDEDKPGVRVRWRLHDRFWLGDGSRLLRREMSYSKNNSDSVESETLETFDFTPKNIKIEAPIK